MLGIRLLATAVVVGVGGWVALAADPKPKAKSDNSPHADALALVLRTQADVIRTVEAPEPPGGKGDERWWHDTLERTWVVKRPAHPGVIDSTHHFDVTYKIDGKVVARWSVDTRKQTVTGVAVTTEQAPAPRDSRR